MVNDKIQVKKIYKHLLNKYPLSEELPNINNINTIVDIQSIKLSHFGIINMLECVFYDFSNIKKIYIDHKWINIYEYKKKVYSLLNIIDKILIFIYPNKLPKINNLNIIKMLDKNNKIIYPIYTPLFKLKRRCRNLDNNFIINSFNLSNNLGNIIKRLWLYRNKLSSINFYLENNLGGELHLVHLLLQCLLGVKMKWMKNEVELDRSIKKNKKYVTYVNNKKFYWLPTNETFYNDILKKINFSLEDYPQYKNKFNKPINLHVNYLCRSGCWVFITYLIYSYSYSIDRFNKIKYNNKFKFGSFKSKNLKICGISGTCTNDYITSYNKDNIKKFGKYIVRFPNAGYLKSSIYKKDWGRFWC